MELASKEESESESMGDSLRGREILGTPFRLFIIVFFQIAVGFLQLGAGLIFVLYVTKGFSILYYNLIGYIAIIAQYWTSGAVGYFGDSVKSKMGRRKPLVIVGVIIVIISIFGIVIPADSNLSQSALFGWFIICQSLLYCGAMIFSTPLSSWIIESTADDADYVRINTVAGSIGQLLGVVLGIVITQVLPPIAYAVITAIISLVSLFLLVWFVPNNVYRETTKQPAIVPSLRTCLRTEEFKRNRHLAVIGYSTFTLYAEFALLAIIFTIAYIVVGLLLSISLNWLVFYYDKIKVYLVMTCMIVVVSIGAFFSSLSSSTQGMYAYLAFSFILCALNSPISTIDTLFVKDLVNYDTLVTGLSRENMYQTAIRVPVNIIVLILGTIPTCIYYGSGFVSGTNAVNDDQIVSKFLWNDAVLWEMRVFSTLVVALIAIASFFVIRNFPINKTVVNQINDAIKKREGEKREPDAEGEMVVKPDEDVQNPSTSIDAPADDDNKFFMNHFSALEVKYLSQNGVASVTRLMASMGTALALSYVALGVLCAGFASQVIKGLEQFSELLIALIVMLTFYQLYEGLRLMAAYKLKCFEPAKAEQLIQSAHEANLKYGESLREKLELNGVSPDASTNTDEFGVLAVDPQDRATLVKNATLFGEENARLSGYKRIFFLLVCLIVFGALNVTVFAETNNKEPSDHTPTMAPTISMAPSVPPASASPVPVVGVVFAFLQVHRVARSWRC